IRPPPSLVNGSVHAHLAKTIPHVDPDSAPPYRNVSVVVRIENYGPLCEPGEQPGWRKETDGRVGPRRRGRGREHGRVRSVARPGAGRDPRLRRGTARADALRGGPDHRADPRG